MGPRRARANADVLRPDVRWNRLAPWPVVSVITGLGAAVVGWCVCAAGCLLGWLQAPQIPVGQPLRLAGQLWLAGQFSQVNLSGSPLSIAPLGLTLVLIVIGSGAATLAVQHCFDVAPPVQQRGRWFVRIGGVFALTYVVAGVAASIGWDAGIGMARTVVGLVCVGVVMAFAGVARALGWRAELELVRLGWPRWLDALPRAIGAGLGVALAGGALVVMVALIQHHSRVVALGAALDAGRLGGVLLLLLQLIWLPNLVLWGFSWLCGAGFTLGSGSVVAPLATQLGLLPAVPMLGAVPDAGVPSKAMALWLVVPALAGLAAAWVLLRALFDDYARLGVRGGPRPDLAGLVGVLAGALTGAVATAVAALSGGSLGQMRLADVGPLLTGLVALACGTMGVGGLLLGLIWGWRAYIPEPRGPLALEPGPGAAPEPTAVLTDDAEPEPTAVLTDDDEPEPTAVLADDAEPELTAGLTDDDAPELTRVVTDDAVLEPTAVLTDDVEPELTRVVTDDEPEPTAVPADDAEPEPTRVLTDDDAGPA